MLFTFFVSFVQKIVSFFVMFGNTFGTTHAIIITVKTPPIHYIKFYYPHSKIPSPKEQRSIAVLLLYAKSGAMLMHRPAYSPFSFLFPYFLRIRPGICILHLITQFKQHFVECCQSLGL